VDGAVFVRTQSGLTIEASDTSMPGAQMARGRRPCEILQRAQALEQWAACRERAVVGLERKAEGLVARNLPDRAARLHAAAVVLRHAAFRERAEAAALREAASALT
jgi:hypothetical protein